MFKSTTTTAALLAAVSCAAWAAAPSQAATIFDVQFTGDTGSSISVAPAAANTTNTKPTSVTSNVSGRNIAPATSGYTDLDTGVTLGGAGNPVAVLTDTSTTLFPTISFLADASDKATSGTVSISADLLLDNLSATSGTTFLNASNASWGVMAGVVFNYDGTGAQLANYNPQGTFKSLSSKVAAAKGQVLHMDWLLDLDNHTQSLQVNGGAVVIGTLPTASEFQMFYVNPAASSGVGKLALDNVKVSSVVPEPASLALLGLGGMLMLRRRGAKSEA